MVTRTILHLLVIAIDIFSLCLESTAFSIHASTKSCQKLEMTRRDSNEPTILTRRNILSSIIPSTLASVTLAVAPQPSFAKDELFKKNPLTNPILEKIRILEQAEADNIQYGGELAPGSPKGRETYAKLLLPILKIQQDLIKIDELCHLENGKGLEDADKLLSKPYFEKIGFKKIFNAFGKLGR